MPSRTLTVVLEPADTDRVVRQVRPPGSRNSATMPIAAASGSTVIVFEAVAPGTPMLDLSRLRLLDGQPTAIERLRMPRGRMRWPEGFDFTGSTYAALESQGIVPTVADAYVDVVDASAAEAGLLGVAAGRGLLRMNCVTSGADGVPISLETSMYHPDRYRFRAILHKRARR